LLAGCVPRWVWWLWGDFGAVVWPTFFSKKTPHPPGVGKHPLLVILFPFDLPLGTHPEGPFFIFPLPLLGF